MDIMKLKCILLPVTLIALLLFPGLVSAEEAAAEEATVTSAIGWVAENWELVALIVSELLAFLPGKYAGITKVLVTVLEPVIKKIAESKSAKTIAVLIGLLFGLSVCPSCSSDEDEFVSPEKESVALDSHQSGSPISIPERK